MSYQQLSDEDLTGYLTEWAAGSDAARDSFLPMVYKELRHIAARYLRNERSVPALDPTALVHETYLRITAQEVPDWRSRSHFFGVAAHLMRQILVDRARRSQRTKRGSGRPCAPLEEACFSAPERSAALLDLDDALKALAKLDTRKSRIIELRFFGGYRVEETAAMLAISVDTVRREQRLAEAWLHRELGAPVS
jgi:RNA polymerase sigma factor (TIGR02999 family)